MQKRWKNSLRVEILKAQRKKCETVLREKCEKALNESIEKF
jgi:hypothetical protein